VRRILGILLVATLIAGRAAAASPGARGRARAVALFGIALGLAFHGADLLEAASEKWAAERASRVVRPAPGQTVWFVGHFGFAFYAERAGMKPVLPDLSELRAGDWLVVPDPVNQQNVRLDGCTLATGFTLDDPVPVRTLAYYAGTTPLERRSGPRLLVRIFRVTTGGVARTLSAEKPTAW
jgi:hypothetical protein